MSPTKRDEPYGNRRVEKLERALEAAQRERDETADDLAIEREAWNALNSDYLAQQAEVAALRNALADVLPMAEAWVRGFGYHGAKKKVDTARAALAGTASTPEPEPMCGWSWAGTEHRHTHDCYLAPVHAWPHRCPCGASDPVSPIPEPEAKVPDWDPDIEDHICQMHGMVDCTQDPECVEGAAFLRRTGCEHSDPEPERCPTCGWHERHNRTKFRGLDPRYPQDGVVAMLCPDPWHGAASEGLGLDRVDTSKFWNGRYRYLPEEPDGAAPEGERDE